MEGGVVRGGEEEECVVVWSVRHEFDEMRKHFDDQVARISLVKASSFNGQVARTRPANHPETCATRPRPHKDMHTRKDTHFVDAH